MAFHVHTVPGSTLFTGDYLGALPGVINIEFTSGGVDKLTMDGHAWFSAEAERLAA